MTVVIAVAGILVTLLTAIGMVLLVPRNSQDRDAPGAFGEEPLVHRGETDEELGERDRVEGARGGS